MSVVKTEELIDVMSRDFTRLGSPSRILVSAALRKALGEFLQDRQLRIGLHRLPELGDVYFRGVLLEVCESLQDGEYAFVRKSDD